MRNENRILFKFYMDQSVLTSRKRKLLEDSPVEKQREKVNLVPEVGEILDLEEIVSEGEK